MNLFICSFLVAVCLADRLENTYVPPSSATTEGGSGSFLSTPSYGGASTPFRSFGSDSEPASSYIPPAAGPVSANSYESSSGYSGNRDSHSTGPQFRILKLDSQNPGDGSYNFEFETENKISQHEAGEVRHSYGDESTNVVRGSYSYTAPDGQQITVNYVADENGFRPEGDHIPTPPPVPEEIKKSLDLNAAQGHSEDGGYQYQDGPDSSGVYEGVEIRSQAENRQYLAPAARQNSQATNRQYLAPTVARQSNEAINRQYLAPAARQSNEAANRQYLVPTVAGENNEATNRQYLAPTARQNIEATSRHYLAPTVARQNNEATNRQYLAPTVARHNNEATNRQYLAPAARRSNEAASREYLAPTVARQNNEATNRQYLAPAARRSNEAASREYLAPTVARQNNEATNRQYLAPATRQNNEATNRQYLAPDAIQNFAAWRNNEATNRQYLAPSISGTAQRNTEAISRQFSTPAVTTAGLDHDEAPRAGQESDEATNRQYLAPAIAKARQDNGGYKY